MNRNLFSVFFESLLKVLIYSTKLILISTAWALKIIGITSTKVGEIIEKIIMKRS